MRELYQIQSEVHGRTESISSVHGAWPCRKGCDDCCRNLAAAPRMTREEWAEITRALEAMPVELRVSIRRRIRESAHRLRPVVCPLLDLNSGACLVYEARPIACRAYGFYAEREKILGCSRIEAAAQSPEIVWGNHAALEDRLSVLGETVELEALAELD